MQVQTHTDRNIDGSAALSAQVEATVAAALGRFQGQVTRVEVHLSDENGDKGGADDKRCMMEARLEGRPPMAITHHAATIELAVDGAAAKLVKVVGSTLDRLRSL